MTDTLTPDERSERMGRIRGRDTSPEMAVRRAMHAAGLRFRLHRRIAGARPDMVFPSRRAALEVQGCFWHRHPDPNCSLTRMPKSRLNFWGQKFAENQARDIRNRAALEAAGWQVFEVWECQVRDAVRLKEVAEAIKALPAAEPPRTPTPRSSSRALPVQDDTIPARRKQPGAPRHRDV